MTTIHPAVEGYMRQSYNNSCKDFVIFKRREGGPVITGSRLFVSLRRMSSDMTDTSHSRRRLNHPDGVQQNLNADIPL